jgi:hypothetical protein
VIVTPVLYLIGAEIALLQGNPPLTEVLYPLRAVPSGDTPELLVRIYGEEPPPVIVIPQGRMAGI